MTEIAYGTKYAETKGETRTQLAKRIRVDIKSAVAAGKLPSGKYSVRCASYAGGGSISVEIADVECLPLFNEERLAFDVEHNWREYSPLPFYSEQARELVKSVEAIVGAYNYDGSDSMTDYYNVRFAAHVDFSHDWKRALKERHVASIVAQRSDTIPAPAGDVDAILAIVLADDIANDQASSQESWLSSLGVLS